MAARASRIFLLSPANCGAVRARMVVNPNAEFPLARRLRSPEGAPLGEVFAFLSGLYFRGKLAYGLTFANPPRGIAGVQVITPSRGLRPAADPVTARGIEEFATVHVDAENPRYRRPLGRDARALAAALGAKAEVVLLGSVASDKYVNVLLPIFGERLLFPEEFVGRGDMSRGGLLLRRVAEGRELTYVPVVGAVRHGPRPPRLEPLVRR